MLNIWIYLLFMIVGIYDIFYMISECNLLCNVDIFGLIECNIWYVGIILMICRKKKYINEVKILMSYIKILICLYKFLI